MVEKKKNSAEQQVYDYICNALYERKLVPGSALLERVFCETLHVGRTAVRTAFARLAADGYVELVPNRGAFIVTGTEEMLRDYYRVRTDLEILALKKSINKMESRDYQYLNEIIQGETEAYRRKDMRKYLDCIGEFYGHLIRKAESPVLLDLFQHLYERQRVLLILYDYFYLDEQLDSGNAHRRIVELLQKKDLDGVIKVLEDHMEQVLRKMESVNFKTADISKALSRGQTMEMD